MFQPFGIWRLLGKLKGHIFECINPLVCLQDGLDLCKTMRLNRHNLEGHFAYTRIIFQCGFCGPTIPMSSLLPTPNLGGRTEARQDLVEEVVKKLDPHNMWKDDFFFFGGVLLIFAVAEVTANGESPGHVAFTQKEY